jgi:hypothetical protein
MTKRFEEVRVLKTGEIYSIASTEYIIIFPDGTGETLWSPPWHELSEEEEDIEALRIAKEKWEIRLQSKKDVV